MPRDILDIPVPYHKNGTIPNLVALAYATSLSSLRTQFPVIIICDHIKEVETLAQLLRSFLHTPVHTISSHTSDLWQAAHMSAGNIYIAHFASATEKIFPSAQQLDHHSREIRVHTPIDLSMLRTWCTEHGYTRNTSANEPWTYASRGEVFDVYIEAPLRVIIEDSVVQDIYTFDLATGERVQTRTHALLLPAECTGSSTLLSLAPHDARVMTWNTTLHTTLHHIDINPLHADETFERMLRVTQYYRRLPELVALSETYKKHIFISTHPDTLIGLLHPKNPEIIKIDGTQLEGCADPETSTLILTDYVLGESQAPKIAQKKKKVPVVMSLKPGDFAVHMFHGIGQFTGMSQVAINDIMHEYFVLEYAKGDKIYVPVELAHYIDTYVGDPHPKVSRLSDASWNEVIARVKEQALQMARDLLHTYARRTIAQAPILLPVDEEEQLNALCEYDLTPDQHTALRDVFADCEKSLPMDRLLCGDVGFGKTEIALRLAFRAAFHHQQVALLAPTTILTQQHFDTFQKRLNTFGIQVAALSRFQKPQEQKQILKGIADGTIDIVIGTHRLLSHDVRWKSLGVIVIDEEQRFGVKAKEGLQHHRAHAHVLTMTATPIPRTLNLSLSGIRDISTIMTAPRERKEISMIIDRFDTSLIINAVNTELARGGQLYYIYNRVQGIESKKKELQELFPHMRIGIAHGQMDEESLSHVMHEFDTGNIDMLLATTIVENGLDIPRANTIIVENATHFGLAELYQLKGRVGRSHVHGYALFLYTEAELDQDAHKRLTALKESTMLGAGFELALRDMEIRGVGNILGKNQHGHAVKIGLNLYGRLLNQAVRELEGNPEPPARDIPIDLPLEARIPEALYPTLSERITLYQELANIADPDELRSRKLSYAHLSSEFAGLFDLLEIQLLASHSSLLSIRTTYPSTHNQLRSERITITSESPLPALPTPWEVLYTSDSKGTKARVSRHDLGSSWIEELKKVIQLLRIT